MAISTSACTRMRRLKRGIIPPQHDSCASLRRWRPNRPIAFSQPGLNLHAACIASAPQNLPVPTSLVASKDGLLSQQWKSPICIWNSTPSLHGGPRRFLSTRGSALADVPSETSQHEQSLPEDMQGSSCTIKPENNQPGMVNKDKEQLKYFTTLLHRGVFTLKEQYEGTGHNPVTCTLSISVPGMEGTLSAQAEGHGKKGASRRARLSLISQLQSAGVWKPLVKVDISAQASLPGNLRTKKASSLVIDLLRQRLIEIKMEYQPKDGQITPHAVLSVPGRTETLTAQGGLHPTRQSAKHEMYIILAAKMREHGIWDELMSKATTTLSASEAPASDAPISGTSANEAPSSEMPTEKDLDLFHKLWHEDKFELDIEFSGNKVQGVTCYVIFAMPDGTGEMQVVEDGKSRRNAKKSAFLLLISNLKQANIWKLLVGDSDGNQANLTMDSDLAYMVRSGKNDLLHARSLFKDFKILQPNQARRRNQTDDQVDHKYRTERSEHLSKALSDLRHSTDPTVVALRSATSRLPVNEHREQVLNLIKNNTYSLIVGETGSGKSTQVPQLILNDAIEQNCGGECNVLCIQPRRVAARMLAQRVANERKERIGQSVGYMIRFDLQRPAKGGAITYCTTGLALSLLQKSPELLNSFSHIILDEVHVRDIDIDFVMLLVKDHITKCLKSDTPAPKIVVMSATVDVNLFSSYFKNTCADGTLEPAPHITIPGRQHHVKSTYLDELLETLSTSFSEQDLSKLLGEPMTAKYLLQHQEKFGETKKDTTGTPASFIEKPSKETISPQTTPRPLPFDEDPLMPFGLICATILNIVSTTENGSVLVFLPGLSHILGVESHLQNFGLPLGFSFADDDQFRILKLHSSLPEEMAKLSDEIPSGCRRVILATEVAEASLTIPDVKYVIDSGKVHQVIYDSTSGSHRTACCWASQSSSVQRSGRAGRVQEGSYFFLGTKKRYDSLRITKSAEILRSDLQATCLRSRMADSDAPITGFLQRAIEPPDNDEVSAAVDSLKQLQALNHKERLTNLGFLMAKLTVISPAFARLVILGVIFRCLDPLLILAALGEEPRLFYQPLNHELRKRVWLHQVSFAGQSCSDHVSHINAFKAVRKTWREEGMRQAWNYCFEHDIYIPAYREAFITASQVLRQLRDARAISTRRVEDDGDEEDLQFGGAKLNTNSHHMPLVNALLQSCLYPRLAAPGLALNKYFITQNQNRALLFSRSMAMDGKRPPRSLLAYSRKVDFASTLFLKDASRISPLAASLFGKNLASKSSGVVVDSWLGIGVSMSDDSMAEAEVLDDLVGLNWALDKALLSACNSIGARLSPKDRRVKDYFQAQRNMQLTLQRVVKGILDRDLDRVVSLNASAPTRWNEHDLEKYTDTKTSVEHVAEDREAEGEHVQ